MEAWIRLSELGHLLERELVVIEHVLLIALVSYVAFLHIDLLLLVADGELLLSDLVGSEEVSVFVRLEERFEFGSEFLVLLELIHELLGLLRVSELDSCVGVVLFLSAFSGCL